MAGQLYYFQFDLVNRAEGQNAPAVSIEVDTLGCETTNCYTKASTADFIYNTTTMDPAPWQSAHHMSGSFMDGEEAKPLFIRSPGFYSHSSVRQSTSHPCEVNTITVTMRVTVPLYVSCGTNLTVTGLTGMATSSDARPTLSLVSSSPANSFEPYTWDQDKGELVLGVTLLDIDGWSDGSNVLSFEFNVENPAEGQPAPTIWLQGSFNDSLTFDGDGKWSDTAGPDTGRSGTAPNSVSYTVGDSGGWVTQSPTTWSLQVGRTYDPGSVAIWKSAKIGRAHV